ncbi:alpha-hydroxy acid oxidase [Microbacterium oryzae]|uniref:Alpha-hydroxy-acid oxidizing enzyme n=1 Tax=Microbacterium oryzae TaxID=743009 RepID=A0A6I6DU86_9MICO|nr:alpha-hydroxy acid oxidase [Microbacterium oryzae]QGU27706.1 alpha-hydroxy-acid oxidizing enzyme [Microbacterium oryzae]
MSRGEVARLRERARERLPAHVFEYVRATADGSDEAEAARWDEVRFRPVSLRGALEVDTRTTVLGTRIAHPVMVAPMAQQVAAHLDGEVETARAAAASGTLLGVSTNTAIPFARIAEQGAPWWFQTYVLPERDLTYVLAERAAAAGASAILLTVELTALRVPPHVEPTSWPDGPARARLVNLTPEERARVAGRPAIGPGLEEIARLRDATGLPVVVKGVLRGDDARRAVDAGAAGIVVSTHGHRRLAGSIAAVDALAEVVEAVAGEAEVYADSGIREARHVLAALALGARAIFVGRPAWWALAAGGGDGVRALLDGMTGDLRLALAQAGVGTASDALAARLAVPPS